MSVETFFANAFNFISNLIGGSIAANSQADTNKANKEIARENNEAMLSAMREQTASEQQYNSMSEQMKRAMIAGVNPMLFAGAQPSTASAAGVPSLDTPVMQNPYQGFTQLGANLGNSLVQAEQIALAEKQINVAEFKAKIDMLGTLGEIGGSIDWTSEELKGVIKAVFGDTFDASSIGSFARDNMVMTRIRNTIDSSNLDLEKKKYLQGWLDEIMNAQYINLLSDTERNQTQSNVNRSIARLNEAKKKEIDQAIKNMAEEWKSIHARGEMDLQRLEKFFRTLEAEVSKLENEATISRNEAVFWTWSKLLEQTPELLAPLYNISVGPNLRQPLN